MSNEKDAPTDWKLGWERYEKVRRLTPREFDEIWRENVKTGIPFDYLVDELPWRDKP